MKKLIDELLRVSTKPMLFESGEPKFWDDPHISKSMLEAHINQEHDLASRKKETIEKTVQHLLESKLLKPGMKVLDLGCGPGLYAERLSRAGVKIVGIDISENSIEYARKNSLEAGLEIDYQCMNFFDMNFNNEFDAVIQVYGELSTFSNEMRGRLLSLIHRALKKDGIFIFDVSTRVLRLKYGLKNSWYISSGGFWRPGNHLVLEQGFDYPEEDVWLDQYIVIDEKEEKIYRNWFHDYSLESIKLPLSDAGFKIKYFWNDLMGSSFTVDGEWIAIGAVLD